MASSAIARLIKLSQELYDPPKILTTEEQYQKTLLESSLHEFVKFSWPLIEADTFVDGWHVKAICDHLELAASFRINFLIINVPPGTMKSTLLSMFNAWVWTTNPAMRFLCLSGTKRLAVKDASRCMQIIESPEYQGLWGDKVTFRKDSKSKMSFKNTEKGYRESYSLGASIRGEGGHIITIDDANTDQEYYSDMMRESKNEYIDSNVYLRLRNPKKQCLINVQQRVHAFDATGHMLSKGDSSIVHLRLPMEYEEDHPCRTVSMKTGVVWEDPRRKEGELLWPERINTEALEKIKKWLGTPYHIAGQLQQRPSPKHGGLIKKEWFREWKYDHMPNCEFVLQSWDTALVDSKNACYSAHTTWGIFKNDDKGSATYGYYNVILLNAWRGKMGYPDLKEMIRRSSKNYLTSSITLPHKEGPKPDLVLIENAGNGFALIEDLRMSGVYVVGFSPKKHGFKGSTGAVADASKVGRASLASSFIEEGFVWLPYRPPHYRDLYGFSSMFLECAINFPRGDGKDVIDTMSQALIKLGKMGWLNYRGMHPDQEQINWIKEQPDPDYWMELKNRVR